MSTTTHDTAVRDLLDRARAGHEDVLDDDERDRLVDEIERALYDGATPDEVAEATVDALTARIERDPAFKRIAAAVFRQRYYREVIGADLTGFDLAREYRATFVTNLERAVDHSLLDERLLERGSDFTAYRIVDVIVDSYFDLLDTLEDQIESIEEAVIESTEIDVLDEINSVRRELLSFRKLLWPAREAMGVLARGDLKLVQDSTEKYFRDVYDHVVQLVDLTETYRDLVSGARDIYLNSLSQSTNEVMKVLTVVATIFIPLTFVAGIYGMNFEYMPELAWRYGYFAVWIVMLAIGLGMVWFFRRRAYI